MTVKSSHIKQLDTCSHLLAAYEHSDDQTGLASLSTSIDSAMAVFENQFGPVAIFVYIVFQLHA